METYKTKPIIIRDFFDTKTCNTILSFMEKHLPMIPLRLDNEGFIRKYSYDIEFFTEIHKQLVNYACNLFGEKVKPSYNFLSAYQVNGKCALHIDRDPCRYTIDYLIRQEQPEPWPIAIGQQMSNEEVSKVPSRSPNTMEERQAIIDTVDWTLCSLNANDAVCYSGTNAWHYRPTESSGNVDLVFFHFVPEDYDGYLK